MKKITFLLFAFIGGVTFAQNENTQTATVNAEIVETIEVSAEGALNFGSFTTSIASATVTLSADGTTRTFSADDMEITSQPTFGVPTFTVSKDSETTYGISLAATTNPTMGTGTDATSMTLSGLNSTLLASGNSDDEFSVGGVLTVPADQAAGIYGGLVTVTVTYE